MSDTNFKPGSQPQYGAGSTSDPGPLHPRGSGMSHDPQHRLTDPQGKAHAGSFGQSYGQSYGQEQGYLDQASHIADDAWRAGQEYYDQGSRRVSEWANEHPNQLWTAIALASAFALWMAYRPVLSRVSRSGFEPSRYRYRRLSRPSGRAAFMERGAVSAERKGREM